MMTSLILGMSVVCSCDEKEEGGDNNAVPEVPTIDGIVLTGMTSTGADEFHPIFTSTYSNSKLSTLKMDGIEYRISHAPFSIECDYTNGEFHRSAKYVCTFNDEGMISSFNYELHQKEQDWTEDEVFSGTAQYNSDKQVTKFAGDCSFKYNGVEDDAFKGEADFMYENKVLKSIKTVAVGKEYDDDTEKMVDYKLTNTFECVYGKNQPNKFGQHTPFDANFFGDGENDIAAVLALIGFYGEFSSVFPDRINAIYKTEGGIRPGEEDDVCIYNVALNDDGTIKCAFGYSYIYDNTRAVITAKDMVSFDSRFSLFRRRK